MELSAKVKLMSDFAAAYFLLAGASGQGTPTELIHSSDSSNGPAPKSPVPLTAS